MVQVDAAGENEIGIYDRRDLLVYRAPVNETLERIVESLNGISRGLSRYIFAKGVGSCSMQVFFHTIGLAASANLKYRTSLTRGRL